jgi:hypothetical protein
MKQLKLSKEHLQKIGFIEKIYPATPVEEGCCPTIENEEQITYEIPCLNGVFYCNINEDNYVWYHKTIIGQSANFVNLDITHLANLFTVLSAFKVKFNLVILENVG